jgi:hypothetical protein
VGPTGGAFIDSLRTRIGTKPLDVYAIDYPASDQWSTGAEGVQDAAAHVISMARDCPKTKMVLGGYSQGAAVMGFLTSAVVPDGVDPATVPKPLAPDVASHVSSVVLFGTPNVRAMNSSVNHLWSSDRSTWPRRCRCVCPRTRCAPMGWISPLTTHIPMTQRWVKARISRPASCDRRTAHFVLAPAAWVHAVGIVIDLGRTALPLATPAFWRSWI